MQLKGMIEKVIFFKESFLIARDDENRTICGTLHDTQLNEENLEGTSFIIEGAFEEHPKHGKQFRFSEFEIDEPEIFFFLTKVVKGIPKKTASAICLRYLNKEKELITLLDTNPKALTSFKGIGAKSIEKIQKSWQEHKKYRKLFEFLGSNVTMTVVKKIYNYFEAFEKDPIVTLEDNIYLLCKISSFGFKKADKIALDKGLAYNDMNRIKAALNFVIQTQEQNGNSAFLKEEIAELAQEALYVVRDGNELHIKYELIEKALESALDEKSLVDIRDGYIASKRMFEIENNILHTLKQKAKKAPLPIKLSKDFITNQEKSLHIKLDETQKLAIFQILEGSFVFALYGYAGTGKSSIAKIMLNALEEQYGNDNIVCCALSGMATDRIKKATGRKSMTIQSLLMRHIEEPFLPYNVVVVDEASMINASLANQLFEKLSDDTKLILLGDPGQLPPIGSGNVFADIEHLEELPKVKLTKVFRASEDANITLYANEVRKGQVPALKNADKDFKVYDYSNPNYWSIKRSGSVSDLDELRKKTTSDIKEGLKKYVLDMKKPLDYLYEKRDLKQYLSYFQILSPVNKTDLGTHALNHYVQDILNPLDDNKKEIEVGPYNFRLADKVLHTKNKVMPYVASREYKNLDTAQVQEQKVLNGMVGIMFYFDIEEEQMHVFYPNDGIVVFYSFEDAEEMLQLAYVISVHKSQGSEYANVLFILSQSHWIMLNTKLLYTAITRAKESFIGMGEISAFTKACKALEVTKRITVSSLLLKNSP